MISWGEIRAMKQAVVSDLVEGSVAVLDLVLPQPTAAHLVEVIRLRDLINGGIYAMVFVLAMFVAIYTLESLSSARRTRYVSRVFRQDVLYTLFYKGGAFEILIWTAFASALAPRLSFLRLELSSALPAFAAYALSWVFGDFLYYWWHRLMHKSQFLWAFHSIHHSQEEMSFATAHRFHPVEMLGYYLTMYVPMVIFGVPTYGWLPVVVAMNIFLGMQHSGIGWGFGRGYYFVVSPRFHALHHSSDRREYLGNYSQILSLWDFLFGTGIRTERPPARLGVDGLPVPRTLVAQLVAPFQILYGGRPRQPAPSSAADPTPAP